MQNQRLNQAAIYLTYKQKKVDYISMSKKSFVMFQAVSLNFNTYLEL